MKNLIKLILLAVFILQANIGFAETLQPNKEAKTAMKKNGKYCSDDFIPYPLKEYSNNYKLMGTKIREVWQEIDLNEDGEPDRLFIKNNMWYNGNLEGEWNNIIVLYSRKLDERKQIREEMDDYYINYLRSPRYEKYKSIHGNFIKISFGGFPTRLPLKDYKYPKPKYPNYNKRFITKKGFVDYLNVKLPNHQFKLLSYGKEAPDNMLFYIKPMGYARTVAGVYEGTPAFKTAVFEWGKRDIFIMEIMFHLTKENKLEPICLVKK